MLRAAYLQHDKSPLLLDSTQEVQRYLTSTNGFLWVSLESSDNSEIETVLRDVFHFHPLAIEDCQSPGFQVAKIDDFSQYIFIITHALNLQSEDEDQITRELDLFLGNNFVVTCYSDKQMPAIAKTWSQIQKDERIARFGPDFL